MSEQLWTDEELKVAAFNLATTYLMDKSAGKATPLSQLIHVHLMEMRDKCATALDAANAKIAELEAQGEWEPVGGGFNSGRLGRFEIQVGITDDRTMYVFNINQNRKCWPVVLPDNIRLCRRKEGR